MDDVEPDEDRMDARRRHNRRMAELDREIAEAAARAATGERKREVTEIPVAPQFARAAAKCGQDAEELWIDRMKARYGYEP